MDEKGEVRKGVTSNNESFPSQSYRLWSTTGNFQTKNLTITSPDPRIEPGTSTNTLATALPTNYNVKVQMLLLFVYYALSVKR